MRQHHGRPQARLVWLVLVLALILSACDLNAQPTPTPTGLPPTPQGATRPGGNPPGDSGAGAQPAAAQPTTPPGGTPTRSDDAGITSGGSIAPVPAATQVSAPTQVAAAETPAPPPDQGQGPAAVQATTTPVAVATPAPPAGVTSAAIKENLRGWIAFIALDNDMWVMPSDGKNARRIIDNPAAPGGANAVAARLHWSPSGRRLMYTVDPRTPGQAATLYVWDADSGNIYSLGQVVGNANAPSTVPTGAWLPDSNMVAVARPDGNVVVRDAERGAEVGLGKGTDPAWVPPIGTCAPAGSLNSAIAVVRGNNIWLIDYPTRAGGERQLTQYGGPTPPWAVAGTMYVWDCRVLFYGDPDGGLGAQGNGMSAYGVNLVTGRGGEQALLPPGGRIQMLTISPDGRYLGLTEDFQVNACIAAGGARLHTLAGQKVADLTLPLVQQGYHAHMFGFSWAPRGENALVVSYNQNLCRSADPGTLQSPIGPRIYLYRLNALDQPLYIGDGTWPAWNAGVLGLGTAPGREIAGR